MSETMRWRQRATGWLLATGIAALWLLARPYTGIRHDGRLYLGQALARIEPEIFGRDLFFAFGSQDRFTLFSPIYALAIQAIGVPLAAKLLLLAAQLAFLAGAALLARRLFPGMLAWLALAAVAAFPGDYGPRAIFAYAEPFLTARSFAEPLVLLGLWLLLAKRSLWAAVCILAAGLLHPLLAAPAVLAAWIFLALADRRWWWAGLFGLAVPALALLGLDPFSRLFLSYDPAWSGIVKSGLGFIFPSTWSIQDWLKPGFEALVVLLAARGADIAARRLFWALAAMTLLGILASVVGADLFSNVLIASAQLWRGAWLLHLASLLALPAVLARLWLAGGNGRAAAALLLAAFFCMRHPAVVMIISAALLFALAEARPPVLTARMLRLVLAAAALLACLGMVDQLSLLIKHEHIAAEALLDGIYIVRTSVSAAQMDSAQCVRNYKSLANVERAFRSLKTVDLKIRPIHHHTANRVRAHIFLCMLAYYVEWHMREAWRELMFADLDTQAKAGRDPVAPAKRSKAALAKVARHTLDDGTPAHSFSTLLSELATIVRNTCRTPNAAPDTPTFEVITTPNAKQQRALNLIEHIHL